MLASSDQCNSSFFFLIFSCEIINISELREALRSIVGDSPGGSDGKESAFNAGDPGLIPGSGRFTWRRKWHSIPVFLPGKSHGWRSLAGYSPWGCKELDTTERLHFLSLYLRSVIQLVFNYKIAIIHVFTPVLLKNKQKQKTF